MGFTVLNLNFNCFDMAYWVHCASPWRLDYHQLNGEDGDWWDSKSGDAFFGKNVYFLVASSFWILVLSLDGLLKLSR